jgi:hypothetical protein
MRPLHNRLNPLRIRKISKTNMLISPLKNVRHPTASTYCLCWTAVVGNNSLSKMYIYARCFVQCYKAHCGTKGLILWSWQRRVLRLCIRNVHPRTIEHHTRMYVYAPVLEAAATIMFMVWLLPCFQRCGICISQKQEKNANQHLHEDSFRIRSEFPFSRHNMGQDHAMSLRAPLKANSHMPCHAVPLEV